MKKILLVINLVLLILFTSCSKSNSNTTEPDNDNKDITLKQEENITTLQKLSSFLTDFTFNAYQQHIAKDDFIVSPLSVFMGLVMIGNTTQDTSSQQIYDALGLTRSEANTLAKELLSNMKKEFYSSELEEKEGMISKKRIGGFDITNSFWVDSAIDLKKNGVLNLINSLKSEVFKVDFRNNYEDVDQRLVDYVKAKTDGIIDLKKTEIDSTTAMLFLNTLYLKDAWGSQNLKLTDFVHDFVNENGAVTKTKLLEGNYIMGRVYKTEKFQHFYTETENGYKLKFIVPLNRNTIEDVFTKESIAFVNSISDYQGEDKNLQTNYYTRCLFPKFEASYDESIKDILKSFGITDIFSPTLANFSGITETKDIYLSVARHAVSLKVEAEGISGAAATAILGSFGAPNGPFKKVYEDFVVDRSFGFIITDPNDVQIFSGVVKNI